MHSLIPPARLSAPQGSSRTYRAPQPGQSLSKGQSEQVSALQAAPTCRGPDAPRLVSAISAAESRIIFSRSARSSFDVVWATTPLEYKELRDSEMKDILELAKAPREELSMALPEPSPKAGGWGQEAVAWNENRRKERAKLGGLPRR